MLTNHDLIDTYVKMFGIIAAIATLVFLGIQIRAALEQNDQILEQNRAIAQQNEYMWFANRPTIKLQMSETFQQGPTRLRSGADSSALTLAVSNVGYTTATLYSCIIERLNAKTGLIADTTQYAMLQFPKEDVFHHTLTMVVSRDVAYMMRVTLNYGWDHSVTRADTFHISRVYLFRCLQGTWTAELNSQKLWEESLQKLLP